MSETVKIKNTHLPECADCTRAYEKWCSFCEANMTCARKQYLESVAKAKIRISNVPVSGGTPSAQVGCSADVCETRIAVESAMKHRGQWEDTPRRPYPQNNGVTGVTTAGRNVP